MVVHKQNTFKDIDFEDLMDQYSQFVEKIAQATQLSIEEIEMKIGAKKEKLSGLVSKEGAAQIVAAELGVNFEKEQIKISVLVEGMRRANVKGRIVQLFPVRSYSKSGREGKVGSFLLADESASIRTVLWDANHIKLIEDEKIREGDSVEVWHGNVKNGELHLSSFSDIKQSNKKIENVVLSRMFQAKNFSEAKSGQSISVRAVIVQVFEPRYFEVCPECGKRVLEGECKVHGNVPGTKRALLNIVLDDGTEIMRSVLFGEQILQLGFTDEEVFSLEKFSERKNSLLGDEKFFSGNIRNNALYNTTEFYIEKIESIDPEALLKELEQKA